MQCFFVGDISEYAPIIEDSYRKRSVIDDQVVILDCKCKNVSFHVQMVWDQITMAPTYHISDYLTKPA